MEAIKTIRAGSHKLDFIRAAHQTNRQYLREKERCGIIKWVLRLRAPTLTVGPSDKCRQGSFALFSFR